MKPKAVLICPGRGTYNRTELGYIARHHADKRAELAPFEALRAQTGQPGIAVLDGAERFEMALHGTGDNASGLIFAASYLDALDAMSMCDVVAVTGNSMGWYTALAVAGAVAPPDAFRVVNTMGTLMHESMIGGQVIYPFVNDDWRPDSAAKEMLLTLVREIDARAGCVLDVSIELGGMLVLAGNAVGLEAFEASVPQVQGRFPLRLPNHSAFHTSLQEPVAAKGREILGLDLFGDARLPLVDGRGAIWFPKSYAPGQLYNYTLGHQVTETYDFTSAIRVAARTFAPDLFVVLGPGDTLGGAVAQSLISIDWQGVRSKADFKNRQDVAPILISLGREVDRAHLARTG